MTLHLTPLHGRAAALAVLLALVGLAYLILVAPVLIAYSSYDRSIEDLKFQLARYNRIAQSRPKLEKRLAQLTAHPPSDDDFLTGAGDAITAAELQRVVTELVGRSRGRVTSTQVLDPSTESGLRKIALSVQFEGDIQALQKILFAIESGKPVLFASALDVRSETVVFRRNARPELEPVSLRTRLDLYGYQLQDTGSED